MGREMVCGLPDLLSAVGGEEMMGERGVTVDHSTLKRWVIKYAPEFEKQFHHHQCPVGRSWQMDETT